MAELRIYLSLLFATLREQMSYRRSFLIEAAGRAVVTAMEVVAIFILFDHIPDLGGWNQWEVLYLYGLASLSLGVAELFGDGLTQMGPLVRNGELDRLLVRPVSPLLQVLGRQCRLYHLGRIGQGAAALAVALSMLQLEWTLLQATMMGFSLVCGILLYGALFLLEAASCFWTTESSELFNAFTYGGVQMTQYPVHIYRPWLRTLFIFVIPVGFVSYFPSLLVLQKPDPLGMPEVAAWLAPVVTLLFLGLALWCWRRGLHRYQSTGS